jgi:hypothetical protein
MRILRAPARPNSHSIAYFFIKDLGRLEASRAIAIGGTGEPWAETLNLLISSAA